MAYRELIKNYDRVRDYMRQFYVYGFKTRGEYDAKSARSYDNERRRVESWMGEYMSFRQTAGGRQVFLSVDSRAIAHNPLYKSFKAKSFTDKDITLHFYLLDLLADGEALTVREIVRRIADDYLSRFDREYSLDESTVRKKLREYEDLGLLVREKQGRDLVYRRSEDKIDLESWRDAIAFFSEADSLGVIGSFLLVRWEDPPGYFRFKHHYILHAMDSQILCALLTAIRGRRTVRLKVRSPQDGQVSERTVCPLKIYASTQNGRQYLLGCHEPATQLAFTRVDTVVYVETGEVNPDFEEYLARLEKTQRHLWGVSNGIDGRLEHLELTVRAEDGEDFIPSRLEREKRNGTVEQLDAHTWRFTADVYDAREMLPWLRTFIGRIVDLRCSNQSVTDTFRVNLEEMARQYLGGDTDAVQ